MTKTRFHPNLDPFLGSKKKKFVSVTDARNITLIKNVDVTMHNKICFRSFNVEQTLRERVAGIKTLISLTNKQNKKKLWKNHKNIITVLEAK